MFGVEEVQCLGFKPRNNKVLVDPYKVQVVQAWESPVLKHNVQSFIEIINFNSRFIEDCAKIAIPLTELTKNVSFRWSEEGQCSFGVIKRCITFAPVLRAFDSSLDIFVTTVTSKFAHNSVSEKDFTDGKHPIAFTSKTLSSVEHHYAPRD